MTIGNRTKKKVFKISTSKIENNNEFYDGDIFQLNEFVNVNKITEVGLNSQFHSSAGSPSPKK